MFKYIKAMAYDKQTIISKLMDKAERLTEHLIKLYLYPSSEYANHWRQEVWSFLNKMPKMKSTGKLPPKDLIYSGLSGYLDECEDLMYVIIDEYSSMNPERSDPDELHSLADDYFKWISNELSTRVAIPAKEVYDKLEQIGF